MGERAGMSGWRAVAGGISDAMTFASRGIPSVNLSAGYYYPHTEQEYVDAAASFETALLILEALHHSDEIPHVTRRNSTPGTMK
jgi:di/tripeptidase